MEVPDSEIAEKASHFKLKEYHFNKEYFSIKPHKAHLILEKFLIPLFELEHPIIEYSESLKDEIRKENLALKYENRLKLQKEEFTSSEREEKIKTATELATDLAKKYNTEERQ